MGKATERIIPDGDAIAEVEQKYGDRSLIEKYRLAIATMLIRLSGARDVETLEEMAADGRLDRLIRVHNERMRNR